ncbi:MAG: anthranilate synthase component I family protein [Planctomycetota bacterium]
MTTSTDHPEPSLVARRWFTPSGAVVAELSPGIDAVSIFKALAGAPRLIYFDSAAIDAPSASSTEHVSAPRLGRYSFVAADPIHSIVVETASAAETVAESFAALRGLCTDLTCATIPGLPPFQGGLAGLVSYECGLARLGVAPAQPPATGVPLVALHVYDVVFAFDHDLDCGWIISQGVPARGPAARRTRATERLAAVLGRLHEPASRAEQPAPRWPEPAPLPPGANHPLAEHPGVYSTHSPASYRDMIRAGIEFVRAGDIFQVNLAQRLASATTLDPVELYLRARAVNPAPFAGYFDAGTAQIASMSPERFLQVVRGTVRMHPIKGTRRVIANPEADLYAGDDLGASAKDRAENVMIVDLVRNDLARVCTPESVRVESLCRLERYRYVQHLVSIVAGRLRPGLSALDALDAALPGGSVTGAPKHRACEIITGLEGVARGAYCGSLGYVGFDGTADFNLLIRTFVAGAGTITFAAGGGITAASDPAAEYAESHHKAEGMLRVLESFHGNAADAATTGEPAR